jgi:hypothetical protein
LPLSGLLQRRAYQSIMGIFKVVEDDTGIQKTLRRLFEGENYGQNMYSLLLLQAGHT